MTVGVGGRAWLEALEAKGRSKSHVETVESHLRVHLVPFFKEKPLDRIAEADVTRLIVHLRRRGLKPEDRPQHRQLAALGLRAGMRRRWVNAQPVQAASICRRPSRAARSGT